jgi:hypothetical protein
LLQSPALGVAAMVVGLIGHGLAAYIVGPRVSGRVTRLHPLVAMAGLLLGDEIGVVDRDGVVSDPVPREKGTRAASRYELRSSISQAWSSTCQARRRAA